MRRLAFPQLLRLPAMGVLVAASMLAAAGPAAAGQGFAPHTWGGPHSNAKSNWGGYAASGSSGEFTTIKGGWTEPVTTCTAKHDLAAPWVGLDGYGTSTVEQTGVQVACNTGKPIYSGWYEMYPASPVYFSNPVSASDKFQASVTASGHSYTLVLQDVTKGWKHTIHKTLGSSKNASAEAVIEAPGGYPGFPNGVTFTNVTVNGHPLSFYSPTKLLSGPYVPGPLNGGTFTIKKG
ncbi:MAG TPA: G1 family glutamic endopeptidase [Streptosporangiaceae bacterium]|nr:G1 family glutamic endopeptidase [Streptosporangiaceae bacterium]